MTAATPLISIVIPAYNAEATLAETLKSALASTHSKLEIVLVDDGSSDKTLAIAKQAAADDDRVRVFHQPHSGVSAALNRGLPEARGDYVARLDADDLWHSSKLEKQLRVMTADPAVAVVYCWVRYIDEDGSGLADAKVQTLSGSALCQCLYTGITGGGSSVLIRKSALDGVPGYDAQLTVWEDLLQHLRLAATGKFAVVPEYLVGYRVRGNSSSNDPGKALASWRLARRRIALEFPQIPHRVLRWTDARLSLELAEAFAREGKFARAVSLLARSVVEDPQRTIASVFVRIGRNLRRGSPPLAGQRMPFGSLDVSKPYFAHPAVEARDWLALIERSRQELLAAFDREIDRRRCTARLVKD